ncbi:MAG: hypothetical protein GTN80_03210 [Nitrososphaeria archaeon]|nr:hypothetical protein [Nitrososphaeria archaeon]NIN52189.1 hypothetical protein [Nitrososphaeria archaeon]NIQ32642.1 hypothetical protein [Nitrososphaeria archaeon]
MTFEPPEWGERVPERYMRYIPLILVVIILLFIIFASGGALLTVWLNIMEFEDLFIRPIYFEIYSGLILAAIALVRIDIINRRSVTWWAFRNLLRLLRTRRDEEPFSFTSIPFRDFNLPPANFVVWQVTKVFLGMFLFTNILFGMAFYSILQGWNPHIDKIWALFSLPFVTPSFDMAFAETSVIPAIPALTLLLSPILWAVGVRLMILVGLTQLLRILMPTRSEMTTGLFHVGERLAAVEGLIALGVFWAMFNAFFPSFIDYNTRYVIGGLAAIGVIFAALAVKDRFRGPGKVGVFLLSRRRLIVRYAPVILIIFLVISIISINNSIADARKIEWLGPYTTQTIAINRYFAELDQVEEVPYNFSLASIPREQIGTYVDEQGELLNRIRLWDWEAAFAKLKPEIGLIPYLEFADSDILRFNGSLYWSASLSPIMPETVLAEDQWYATHLHYTHAPKGFFLLDAHEGRILETEKFFKQQKIYYGEGGLLREAWASYPVGREESDELEGAFYMGGGGLDVAPPLSWIYEFNFFLAYRDQPIHLLRYRDIYNRLTMLFPYFQYNFFGKPTDMFPVTDGERTYYLMPLIVRLETRHVMWGQNNPFMRFIGYALINIYDGDIQLLITGDDFFSDLFKGAYSEYVTTEIPEWLKDQTRYPEELFEWRVDMYNFYHVVDPSVFIVGKEFFEVPIGLDTYYIMAQPPGFDQIEFLGLSSLELRGAQGRNLAGYMVLRNDYDHLGEMVFYEVSLEAETKLLGPTGVLEALEKNSDFAQLKTLLRSPRIGDNILYRVGDHDVYFIPVYTAMAGGVVTEQAVIASVGAAFTGEYFVGLGDTAEDAFEAYLSQLAGVAKPPTEKPPELTLSDLIQQANEHMENYMSLWAESRFEEAGKELARFMELWQQILERM